MRWMDTGYWTEFNAWVAQKTVSPAVRLLAGASAEVEVRGTGTNSWRSLVSGFVPSAHSRRTRGGAPDDAAARVHEQPCGTDALRQLESTERGVQKAVLGNSSSTENSVRGYQYAMQGHAEQSVDKYCELAHVKRSTLKKVATPCIDDHMFSADELVVKGELHDCCARIVLKVLYFARMNRTDLLWSVNSLAREVTKWTVACDKRLHRLICYINCTTTYVQQCWVGNKISDCKLGLFCDASFAGDLKDSKSTSGS